MGFKTISWAKNVPPRMKWIGMARHCTIGYFLRSVFIFLEWFYRSRRKDVLLFVIPYEEYDENTRYLFEHATDRLDLVYRRVLFVYHEELFAKLQGHVKGEIVLARSWEGFRAFFSARIAFTSRGALVNAFYPYVFLSPFKRFINLWHGIPLKRIGFLAKDSWESLMRLEVQRYSAMTVCSAPEQFTMALSNEMRLDDIWITNTPRNDLLFRRRVARTRSRTARGRILYAPTYRDGAASTTLFPFPDVDLDTLCQLLRERNFELVIRRHVLETTTSALFINDVIGYDNRDDIEEGLAGKLCVADILITDYSSIYLDYLALDRPVIFIPYDKDAYEAKRGLMYDYDSVTPGAKANTFASLLGALRHYMIHPESDAQERRAVARFFHLQQDGQACQRIVARALNTYGEPSMNEADLAAATTRV